MPINQRNLRLVFACLVISILAGFAMHGFATPNMGNGEQGYYDWDANTPQALARNSALECGPAQTAVCVELCFYPLSGGVQTLGDFKCMPAS